MSALHRRVILVGLDCLAPALAFDVHTRRMPFLKSQLHADSKGLLRSCTPPITVPAWASMLTGKDPGELGVYGFRNRVPGSYALASADRRAIQSDWIWDRAQQKGVRSAALFVPGQSPLQGTRTTQLACFLNDNGAPWCKDGNAAQTEILQETLSKLGDFASDVPMHEELDAFSEGLFATGKYRFDALRTIAAQLRHELICFVDLGADRLHHQCFADALDDENSDSAELVNDYYGFLDAQLVQLYRDACSQSFETIFLVVSDHGAQPITSALYLNQWLEDHGFLVRENQEDLGPLRTENIRKEQTVAWAEGGYYGRIMLNLHGREPDGIVAPESASEVCSRIRTLLLAEGSRAQHKIDVQTADELYRDVRGLPPDLFVSVDDYGGRILSSFRGPKSHWGNYDDVGKEPGRHGCNHALDGVAVAYSTQEGPLPAPSKLADVYAWLDALL